MQDLSGQQIKGYELREILGAGGFGAVYRAHQPVIGREVAIKIILPHYANHPDFIRRFEVEAQVIARLEHPHIIPLYDYWRDPDGAYLVMRYLRGGSLRRRLDAGPLNLLEASSILDQVAGALAVAHRQGVVHRDIKPDNVLFDESGNAYLTDFGIAKDLGSSTSVTQGDMVIGSPAYLSPEQVRGDIVTPQADIYGLGVVLYEMVTGQHPFPTAQATSLLLLHLNEPLPPLSGHRAGVPEGMEAVIQRATAKDPRSRYSDALAFASAFRQAVLLGASSDLDTEMRARLASELNARETMILQGVDVENPYKGLRAFQEADAPDFFGREALISRLLARLRGGDGQRGARFVAVVGPSGSGKSSLVKAGVIPRMRRDTLPGSSRWFIVELSPGAHPLEELEAALLRIAVNPPSSLLEQLREDKRGLVRAVKRVLMDDHSELFLLVDQFEELFTLAQDRAEVAHFLGILAEAAADPQCPLRTVITLRADFYDKPLLFPAFGDLLRRSTEVVLPMAAEDLERAITGPAERAGVRLEPGLATQIIADVSEQPGALPLMEYALTQLFERRSGALLTLEAYQALGGALGALARRAEELYGGLDQFSQEMARQLFLRLVRVGSSSAEDTRRRLPLAEITPIGDDVDPLAMERVIDVFDAGRLLTFDNDPATRQPVLVVAHDALIHEWGRLRDWLAASREDLLMQRRLEAAAGEWQRAGCDPSYLASGARLEQFQDWRARTQLALNVDEIEYLQASAAEREAQQRFEAERQAREAALEQRSRQRLRLLLAVMTAAAVVAGGLAALAFTQSRVAQEARVQAELNAAAAATAQAVAETSRQAAETSADAARRSASEARSLALAANARSLLGEHNPPLALALAVEAQAAYQPPLAEVQQALALVAYGPGARWRLPASGSVLSVAASSRYVLAAALDGSLTLWDLDSGQPAAALDLGGAVAASVAISPDGRFALTGLLDGGLLLWDLDSGRVMRRLGGHTGVVSSVVFSRDGALALSGALDRTLRLWDVRTGAELLRIDSPGAILTVALSPDASMAVSGSADVTAGPDHPENERDRTVRVWDLRTGAELRRFRPNSGFVRAVAFSPDGQHVLAGTWNSVDGGALHLWRVESGRLERRFYGHSDVVTAAHFSPDGARIVSASWDHTVRVWDTATGLELQRFDSHDERPLAAAFTPNGQFVVVGTGSVGSAGVPDPVDDRATSASVWVWDLTNRAEAQRFTDHADWVWAAAVSPDGRYAATGSGAFAPPAGRGADNTVRLWNLRTGREVRRMGGHADTVSGVAFSPDGALLASASWDGTVRLWDTATGRGRVGFRGHAGRVLSVAFSPDGARVVSASRDGTARLWDAASGAELRRFDGHQGDVNWAAFSPDGQYIATGGADGSARLWDAATGVELRRFDGHTGAVNVVAFSPDGRRLLTSSSDGTARLWSIATGEEQRQLAGHTRAVFAAAFSPDGGMVATGSADASVRLWDAASGEEIRRYDGHTGRVLSAAFTPDGAYLLTGAEDSTARVWRVARTVAELVTWARANRYLPALTCPQRVQYRVEPLCPAEDG